MEVHKTMNQRLQSIITKEAPSIAKKYHSFKKELKDTRKVEETLHTEIDSFSVKLQDFTIKQLTEANNTYTKFLHEIMESMINDQASNNNDQEDEYLFCEYKVITAGLNAAINHKKKVNIQNPTHFLELTTVRHPVFIATTPIKKSLEEYRDDKGVLQIHRKGLSEVTYRNERGVILGNYDAKVMTGLFKLWGEQGKTQKVSFEFKDLVKAMNTKPSGGEYRLIHESLENLYATSMVLTQFYGTDSKIHATTDWIHFFSHLRWIARSENEKDGKERAAEITFSDFFQNSLLAGNIIFISMVLLNELPSNIAKTVYLTVLGAIQDDSYSFNIDQLIEHISVTNGINMPQNRTRSIQKLEQAFLHLQDAGVIEEYEIEKKGNKRENIHFKPSDWILSQKTTNRKHINGDLLSIG
jgi:Replication initiator protein A